MKYLLIVADTNDADYVTSLFKITEQDLKLITPVINAIASFKPYKGKRADWEPKHHHNFPYGENLRQDLGEKTVEELYVESGLCSPEALEAFIDCCPYGDYGIHTITEVKILEVSEVTDLLKRKK